MDLFTLKQQFKKKNNFLKIFNHNKQAKQEFQRLEFLGDRVLALVLSAEVYKRFSSFNEGKLATIFSFFYIDILINFKINSNNIIDKNLCIIFLISVLVTLLLRNMKKNTTILDQKGRT